eukprot:CAMPEP_0206408876 /NCGR_PEP_ID=MMETSP0294-20121207/31459_1 /ASSEMBLY_ACC=CAM_ASM_000327 /TAXON_ID=39354 /ORGANISM="Heterosigma akashiwo, Strain CCMP2393" /LENGTH=37 /DNA_ID= /DNA_START= /DNA_END= /DNA_ORIENTATION=
MPPCSWQQEEGASRSPAAGIWSCSPKLVPGGNGCSEA